MVHSSPALARTLVAGARALGGEGGGCGREVRRATRVRAARRVRRVRTGWVLSSRRVVPVRLRHRREGGVRYSDPVDLAVVLTTFVVIFPAELPDKSLFA